MTAIARAAGVATSAIIRYLSRVYRWARENRWTVLTGFLVLVLFLVLLRSVGLLGWLSYRVGLFQAEARIYVEPPQVYTRERLVNDRFRETNWLENRLKNTGTGSDEGPSRYSGIEANTSVAAGNTTDRQRQVGEPQQTTPPPLLSIDKIDAFNLDFERRAAVRSEMLNTLLDDGHDLSGSTLYRMNFDVSVVPEAGARGFGVVAIDAESYRCKTGPTVDCFSLQPDARLEERINTYRDLLKSWEQDLQEFLSKVYRDRTSFRRAQLAPDPFGGSPKERMAFNGYVKAKAVEYWVNLVAGSNRIPKDTDCVKQCKDDTKCAEKCELWYSNMESRVQSVRQALNMPGSATLLATELPERVEHGFTREIKIHTNIIADRIKRRELERFVQDVKKTLDACPKRADNQPGCATCWTCLDPVRCRNRGILPSCKGTGPPAEGNATPQDPGLLVVAEQIEVLAVNPGGQPANLVATAAHSANSASDSPTGTPPEYPAIELDMATFLRLTGLPGEKHMCPPLLQKQDLEGQAHTPCDALDEDELRKKYSAILSSQACSGGRPFFLPWKPGGTEVQCPEALPDHVMSMYGLVSLASLVRDMHQTMISNATDWVTSNHQGSAFFPPATEDIVKRSQALYGCISKETNHDNCKDLCLSSEISNEIDKLRRKYGMPSANKVRESCKAVEDGADKCEGSPGSHGVMIFYKSTT